MATTKPKFLKLHLADPTPDPGPNIPVPAARNTLARKSDLASITDVERIVHHKDLKTRADIGGTLSAMIDVFNVNITMMNDTMRAVERLRYDAERRTLRGRTRRFLNLFRRVKDDGPSPVYTSLPVLTDGNETPETPRTETVQ